MGDMVRSDTHLTLTSMQLSDPDLDSFITAYNADFGEAISRAEALVVATRLTALFQLLATDPAPDTGPQVA